MALATYGDLKTTIANTIGRADLTTPIADFVALAHADIMRDMRGDARLQKRDTAFSIAAEYVAVPTDFLELVSMYINTSPKQGVRFISSDQMNPYTTTGTPAYVTVVGATTPGTECFRFAPAPSGTMTATIEYYATITFFSADGTTNWILTRHPALYLYGSLYHAAIYVKDREAAEGYRAVYNEMLQLALQEGKRTRWGGNQMAVRPA